MLGGAITSRRPFRDGSALCSAQRKVHSPYRSRTNPGPQGDGGAVPGRPRGSWRCREPEHREALLLLEFLPVTRSPPERPRGAARCPLRTGSVCGVCSDGAGRRAVFEEMRLRRGRKSTSNSLGHVAARAAAGSADPPVIYPAPAAAAVSAPGSVGASPGVQAGSPPAPSAPLTASAPLSRGVSGHSYRFS